MRNTILYGLMGVMLCMAGCGRVQQETANEDGALQVSAPQLVSESGARPIMSPSGDMVLVHGASGLERVDTQTGERTLLSAVQDIDGDVVFSRDGNRIAYRKTRYIDHLRYYQLEEVDLRTGEVREKGEPTREREAFRFDGESLYVAGETDLCRVPMVAVEEDELVVYTGTKRNVISPNGPNTYLWASISPDEQRIVYVAIYDVCHTYVCDLNGSNVVDLGYYIGAPTWYGNDWIIGQQDEDDGYQMTGSRLVAVRADGSGFQVLETPDQTMTINPGVGGNTIVYENEGKVYELTINE